MTQDLLETQVVPEQDLYCYMAQMTLDTLLWQLIPTCKDSETKAIINVCILFRGPLKSKVIHQIIGNYSLWI